MEERKVTPRGGRFDGKVVEVDPKARELWAYMNIYAVPRAVKAGGLPPSESLATYRLVDVADIVEYFEGA